ncbi:hypothetical protein [Acidocella facilis]|uniref:hypothetical protein n=1 Tax=Acidocella facilis TaxID=525 RepID=UPI001F3F7AAB|nr:hypothetical protein [Acidocella facilis]
MEWRWRGGDFFQKVSTKVWGGGNDVATTPDVSQPFLKKGLHPKNFCKFSRRFLLCRRSTAQKSFCPATAQNGGAIAGAVPR